MVAGSHTLPTGLPSPQPVPGTEGGTEAETSDGGVGVKPTEGPPPQGRGTPLAACCPTDAVPTTWPPRCQRSTTFRSAGPAPWPCRRCPGRSSRWPCSRWSGGGRRARGGPGGRSWSGARCSGCLPAPPDLKPAGQRASAVPEAPARFSPSHRPAVSPRQHPDARSSAASTKGTAHVTAQKGRMWTRVCLTLGPLGFPRGHTAAAGTCGSGDTAATRAQGPGRDFNGLAVPRL